VEAPSAAHTRVMHTFDWTQLRDEKCSPCARPCGPRRRSCRLQRLTKAERRDPSPRAASSASNVAQRRSNHFNAGQLLQRSRLGTSATAPGLLIAGGSRSASHSFELAQTQRGA
jgi:hypothetical protein